jgi:hypothetical protein
MSSVDSDLPVDGGSGSPMASLSKLLAECQQKESKHVPSSPLLADACQQRTYGDSYHDREPVTELSAPSRCEARGRCSPHRWTGPCFWHSPISSAEAWQGPQFGNIEELDAQRFVCLLNRDMPADRSVRRSKSCREQELPSSWKHAYAGLATRFDASEARAFALSRLTQTLRAQVRDLAAASTVALVKSNGEGIEETPRHHLDISVDAADGNERAVRTSEVGTLWDPLQQLLCVPPLQV